MPVCPIYLSVPHVPPSPVGCELARRGRRSKCPDTRVSGHGHWVHPSGRFFEYLCEQNSLLQSAI